MTETLQHPTTETLSAYLDGELAPADVAGVERHLSDCGTCREQMRRLRLLVASAGALPHAIQPPAEVWTRLHRRLDRRRAPGALRAARSWRTVGWLAAAAVLVLAGTTFLDSAGGRSRKIMADPPMVVRPAVLVAVDRNYAPTLDELRRTLATQRDALSPSTVRVLEHSIALIDSAIAEASAALASDPANAALVEILSAQYERKVDLLQRATKLSPSI